MKTILCVPMSEAWSAQALRSRWHTVGAEDLCSAQFYPDPVFSLLEIMLKR
jgi:hypothetical protein